MYMKINKEKTRITNAKTILTIGDATNIIGFTNNSKFHIVNLLSENNDNISLKAKDWSEYLKMIKYTRQIIK